MYKTVLFEGKKYLPEYELEMYLNDEGIPREKIVSISMSVDSAAKQRFVGYSIFKILLVYEQY